MPEIIEAILRSAFGFIALLVLTRLVGKQQISHLTFYDFVAAITIGGITAQLIGELDVSVWPIFAALATFIGAYCCGQLCFPAEPASAQAYSG